MDDEDEFSGARSHDEEEEDEDDLGNENVENETENPINIPSVRRVTARARSPLQLTQESVAVISTMPDALEIVGVAGNDNEMVAQVQPIVRDLSDPKYDFEIFSFYFTQFLPIACSKKDENKK